MYISLYRKYRPQKFSEVVGQGAATNMLRLSFLEGRLGHAYLFSGPRGCGKTTAARLLAKIVNCERPSPDGEPCCECRSCISVVAGDHMDVMEIDGASNRGIDQIRELKSHVGLASFMGGRKVYILDEVHMLTTEAFNALLKTLEEPPSSALFVFATTEPHKVPVTIRSRCQHIPFHRISAEDMVAHLKKIAALENVPADDPALWEIARSADGALRDALSLAEQASALGGGKLDMDSVRALFGGGSRQELEAWLTSLRTAPAEAASALRSLLEKGVAPERFLDALFPLLRDMWVYALWGERSFDGVSLSEDEKKYIRSEAPGWGADVLRRAAGVCSSLMPRARWGLKSDVFSGLLLFEMMALLDGETPVKTGAKFAPLRETASSNLKQKDSAPVEAVTHTMRPPDAPNSSRVEAGAKFAPLRETGDSNMAQNERALEPNPELPEGLGALSKLDMPVAAAVIDVKISLADGAMIFDFSEVSAYARNILEMPKAKLLVAHAFGVSEPEKPARQEPSAAARRPEAAVTTEGARVMPVGPSVKKDMSIEDRSAYLGADLLMYKPLAPQADDDGAELLVPPDMQE